MIPNRCLLLEGPDCCGKTTLYNNIHKVTGFGYNIIDRSRLSRLCYARLYNRPTESDERDALLAEMCDANVYSVILLPKLETVLERLRRRGDEFQDEQSIKLLHQFFVEEASFLSSLPNVLIVREDMTPGELTSYVLKCLKAYESLNPASLLVAAKHWSNLSSNYEVQFSGTFNIPADHNDPEILNDKKEGEYYSEILNDIRHRIYAELTGMNVYGVAQDLDSRRFYYSSDSCISSIHFLQRGRKLKVICNLRSTDADRNASIDARFLSHLAAEIPRNFEWPKSKIELIVRMNSLHIRNDIV